MASSPAVSGGATLSAAAPGATSIVMTSGTATLAASTAVIVTLSGLTMGSTPTAGGSVTVQTSADVVASNAVQSCLIYCTSAAGNYCPAPFEPSVPCSLGSFCPFPNMNRTVLCAVGFFVRLLV
jgi:hypothetical protein